MHQTSCGPTRHRSAAIELTASAALLAWNIVINRAVPAAAYVPANLAAAGLSVATARQWEVPVSDLGLRRDGIPAGLRVGLAVSAPLTALVARARPCPRPGAGSWTNEP